MVRISIIASILLVLLSCERAESDHAKENSTSEIHIYSKHIGWDKMSVCQIRYKDEDLSAKVKYRGGMSSRYDKHSMTIELKLDRSLAGLPENDDWILNASYIDKTFQRHKLSYDLFRAMDKRNIAPRCEFVPVFLNDKPQGLYVLMEKVNGSWLVFDKKNPGNAALFKDAFVFTRERLPNVQDKNNYYGQKFPGIKAHDLTHEMDAFHDFLFNSSDAEFASEIEKRVDLENVIDWHLLLMFTNNDDGLYKNFYIYREKNQQKLRFIPWDYDHSFGRDGDYSLNLIDREVGWQRMILFKRLMEVEETGYSEKLKSRWLELRKGILTEKNINAMIDANDRKIRPYLKQNESVWPLKSKWYTDENSYDEELKIIRKYVTMRLEQLDNYFNTL